jgi:nucleotide-binding universal stress UspA family protein
MLSLPKILAPIDFSERSPGGTRFAGALACHFGSELTLLHVIDTSAYGTSSFEFGGPVILTLPEERRSEAETRLENFLPEDLSNLNVRRVALTGDPAREIVGYAHSEGASLIVIPTHGYGPFRRFILGSVAAKILHDADCPVFTGAHLPETVPDESLAFRNILCAVDFCPQSEKALEWASEFAGEFHAQLTLVHITPSIEGRVGEYFDPAWRGHWAQDAREKVETMQKNAGTNAAVLIDANNNVPEAVAATSAQIAANLVVIGRAASHGVLGRLRTNSYAIIRQSPCPVVSV